MLLVPELFPNRPPLVALKPSSRGGTHVDMPEDPSTGGLRDYLKIEDRMFADLPNLRASDNPMATIPMEILSRPSRPDIVMRQNEVILLELTVPFKSPESMSKTKQHKESKELYQLALSDLEANGFDPLLLTLEIGALGHWLPSSRRALMQAFSSLSKSL